VKLRLQGGGGGTAHWRVYLLHVFKTRLLAAHGTPSCSSCAFCPFLRQTVTNDRTELTGWTGWTGCQNGRACPVRLRDPHFWPTRRSAWPWGSRPAAIARQP